MAIERVENEHGGWGYLIPSGTPIRRIPADALALLDESDRAMFLDPVSQLDRLVGGLDDGIMRDFVQGLRDGGLLELEAQFAPEVGPGLKELYFRFRVAGTKNFPAVQFSKADPDPGLPAALIAVFKVFDAVDCDFEFSSNQIHHPRNSEPLPTWGMTEDAGIDAEDCRSLYVDPCGDMIGWHRDGRAVLCMDGNLSIVGTISEFLAAYFADQLRDDRRCGEAQDYVREMTSQRGSASSRG